MDYERRQLLEMLGGVDAMVQKAKLMKSRSYDADAHAKLAAALADLERAAEIKRANLKHWRQVCDTLVAHGKSSPRDS